MPNLPPPGCRASVAIFLLWAAAPALAQLPTTEIPPIKRVLPPEGIEIPADVRERLETRLAATKKRLEAVQSNSNVPDVEIFTKAVELALLHREFYVPKDFAKADWALDEANKRLDALEKGQSPWNRQTGLVVCGYRSLVDHSVQPYGLVVPEGHDFDKPYATYVWLHGRGDKSTDLHFLHERATKVGQIAPPGAIVLHPFGRHCVGYKHAGETDVLETVVHRFAHEKGPVILVGFSMGGAGAWHLGAHYPDFWTAVSPGAGFAETARYQRLSPDRFPPIYEQRLWGQYDVPGYVRNLFNTEVIAYSGELDKQIQAARVMEEAYLAEGRKLTHLIGPGVEHKYEHQTLKTLLARLAESASTKHERPRKQIHLQTRTLRYSHMDWVQIRKLEEHWQDSRVDAEIAGPKSYRITTKNVTALKIGPGIELEQATVTIDGQTVAIADADALGVYFVKRGGKWQRDPDSLEYGDFYMYRLDKRPGLTGPIDDAFSDSFLVVVPSGKSRNPRFQEWQEFELAHFLSRWRALMRGEPRVVKDTEVTAEDLAAPQQNLILWGDPDSNSLMARLIKHMPITFSDGRWKVGETSYDGDQFVPALVYPREQVDGDLRSYDSYLVLNSGLTFREGHDHTNSLQNPKLPDWAIIDMTQPPDAFAPGRIHDAGFFDENWQLKGPPKGPGENDQ